MPLCEDTLRPLSTSVVFLKSYGKGPDDVHTCKSKRPHLMVLFPDVIQLFTTSDAGEELSMESSMDLVEKPATVLALGAKNQWFSRKSRTSGGNFMKERKFHHLNGSNSMWSNDSGISQEEDVTDLKPGQVFRLNVAISQILSVDIVKGKRLKIWYQPNRPSKRGIVEEQTILVLRTIMNAMDYRSNSKSNGQTAPTKGAHHFTIVLSNEDEAVNLKYDIERAQKQLALATLWLSDGLPLRPDSSIVMATINQNLPRNTQSNDHGFSQVYALNNPVWGKEIVLPEEMSYVLSNPNSRLYNITVITVHLQTPLGRAVVEIPCAALLNSSYEDGKPIETPAVLQDGLGDDSLRPGKSWKVILQWKAVKGSEIDTNLNDRESRILSPDRHSKYTNGDAPSSTISSTSESRVQSRNQVQGNRCHSRPNDDGVGVLIGLVALTGVVALVRAIKTQFSKLTGPSMSELYGIKKSIHKWSICFLNLEIDEETEDRNAAISSPPIRRAISVTAASGGNIDLVGSTLESTSSELEARLPKHICTLIAQHPSVLTTDLANRFIVGLGSENKAHSALSAMAQWTKENGYVDIVRQKQPAFQTIKKHFPHGFMGWSNKKDCLIELECMGRWPAAYDKIIAEGVTEKQMLEHYLFIYQYAFTRLDTRHLPHGKTVKIIDLEGLSMSQLKSPGFKFLTRVGAMLALNYPQRLHKCFLLNAPGWWAVAWKLISPIIPAKVREQMVLYGKNDKESARKAVTEWIDEDILPEVYGGRNGDLAINEWKYEKELLDYVLGLNNAEKIRDSNRAEIEDISKKISLEFGD